MIGQEIGQIRALGGFDSWVCLEVVMTSCGNDGFVKTAMTGTKLPLGPNVPLAEHGRGVPGRLQCIGHRHPVQRQVGFVGRWNHLAVRLFSPR